LYSAVRS